MYLKMLKKTTVLLITFLWLSYAGAQNVVNIPELPKTLKEKISAFEAKAFSNANNPAFLAELGNLYLTAYRLNHQKEFREKALNQYEKFSKLVSDNLQVIALIYELQAEAVISGDMNVEKLKLYYASHPELKNTAQAAPSYYEASDLLLNKKSKDKHKILQLLKKSLKDNPRALRPYIFLINQHIENERFSLAKAVLKQAEDNFPDNKILKSMYADIIYKKIHSQDCVITNKTLIKEGINLYRASLKNTPNDVNSRESLAYLYNRLGLYQLELVERNRVLETDDSTYSKAKKALTLLFLDRTDDSINLMNKLLKEDPRNIVVLAYFPRILITAGQWKKASKLFGMLFAHNKESVGYYDIQRYAFSILMSVGKEDANKIMAEKLGLVKMGTWEAALSEYFMGELSKKQLLKKATNSCRLSEAYYSIAMHEWQQGNTVSARDYFIKIKEEKVFPYFEYIAAKRHIEKLTPQK